MTLRDLLIQIILKFVLGVLFLYFAVDGISNFGWGFISILSVIFSTNNFVQGIRMLDTYFKIKKNIDGK